MARHSAANLRSEIPDFRGFDSSGVSVQRGGTLRPAGNFPDILSRRILSRDDTSREIGRSFRTGIVRVQRSVGFLHSQGYHPSMDPVRLALSRIQIPKIPDLSSGSGQWPRLRSAQVRAHDEGA